VQACRTGSVDPDPVANFAETRFAAHLAHQRDVAPAHDDSPAPAIVRLPQLTAMLLCLVRAVRLLRRAAGIARRPGLGLCRAPAVKVTFLRALHSGAASPRDEPVRRADLLRPAKATGGLRLLPVSFRDVAARRACFLHVHPAIGLTREPASHLVAPVRLFRLVDQAYPPAHAPRLPLDLYQQLAQDCLLRVRQHASVAECSLDFRL
jgi:hypothetical protein